MKRHLSIVLLLLISSACGNEEHTNHATTTQPNTSTGATVTTNATAPYDLQFLDTMTHHHQGAIDMVKAAQGRFSHKELAGAGEKIVADQQQEIAQMRTWRDQWYPGAPPAVNMNMPAWPRG